MSTNVTHKAVSTSWKKKIFFVFVLITTMFCNFVFGIFGVLIGLNYSEYIPSLNSASSTNAGITREVMMVNNEDVYIDVVERTQDAVVSIIISKDVPIYEEYYSSPFDSYGRGGGSLFDQFFGQMQRRQVGEEEQQIGAGSGFIVSEEGYVVSNRHVVSDSDASYTIIFNNGEQVEAEVLARDDYLDIAILKFNPENQDFKYIEFGNSDEIKVGQQVLAIGNSLGEFQNTVSTGIISGLSRSITAGNGNGQSDLLEGVIQTDASINPGNSGGPLLNLNGQVIGVNVAVAANAENIGFAIPTNSVKTIVESVKETGKIVRPYIGVRYVQINPIMAEKNELEVDYGALIIRGETIDDLAVIPGSPADKAGILENDIILEVNGVKLDEETSLQAEIRKFDIGDEVDLKIWSKGEEKDVKIVLEANE